MVVLCVQSCLTLYDPMDYSLPGSSVHAISQARILEWVAISSSMAFSPFLESIFASLTVSLSGVSSFTLMQFFAEEKFPFHSVKPPNPVMLKNAHRDQRQTPLKSSLKCTELSCQHSE